MIKALNFRHGGSSLGRGADEDVFEGAADAGQAAIATGKPQGFVNRWRYGCSGKRNA